MAKPAGDHLGIGNPGLDSAAQRAIARHCVTDDDVLLLWAAEELLAAGRSGDAASKRVHRRNGEFFVDIGQRLRIDGQGSD